MASAASTYGRLLFLRIIQQVDSIFQTGNLSNVFNRVIKSVIESSYIWLSKF